MIRSILCALSSKFSSNALLKSNIKKSKEAHEFISKSWKVNFSSAVSSLVGTVNSRAIANFEKRAFLEPPKTSLQQVRTVIKYSLKKGRRKSVSAVTDRFFRLHWGIWIRTRAGRHKKLWKKSATQRRRLSNHVFCNATQSRLLDTMVNKFWRKPKYYIEDPYEPYHKRENFGVTRRKPWRPEGVDYE